MEDQIVETASTNSLDITEVAKHNQNESWDLFSELKITSLLSRGKYPVFQADLDILNINFALKVFPFIENKISPYYLNEIKFYQIHHKHVIQYIKYKDLWSGDLEIGPNSCILMELAQYGDFQQLLAFYHIPFTEVLARTYFHQLVDGLEYLHSQGIAHLDLKLENLLLDEKFQLKIADFDLAYLSGDTQLRSRGSKFYRAPELENRTCKDPMAADIYSLGIIIFVLLSRGVFPFNPEITVEGHSMEKLLQKDPNKFWNVQSFFKKKNTPFFDEDFKELFRKLTENDPQQRLNIDEIRSSKWFKKRIYNDEQLQKVMTRFFNKIEETNPLRIR